MIAPSPSQAASAAVLGGQGPEALVRVTGGKIPESPSVQGDSEGPARGEGRPCLSLQTCLLAMPVHARLPA
jgi:hypothetical protein